jgi:hypothetical protein
MFSELRSKESLLFVTTFIVAGTVLFSGMVAMRMSTLAFGIQYEFFIIPLALLGLGVGGALAFLHTVAKKRTELFKVALVYPLTALLAFALLYVSPTAISLVWLQVVFFTSLSAQYVSAGWILSTICMQKSRSISLLYFFDLVGAAFGVLAAVVVADIWGFGYAAVILCIAMGAPALLLAAYASNLLRMTAGFLILMVVGGVAYAWFPGGSACKEKAFVYQRSNFYSEVEAHARRPATDGTTLFPEGVAPPGVKVYRINIDCSILFTSRLAFDDPADLSFLEEGLRSIPFAFMNAIDAPLERAFIPGAGGGIDVHRSQHYGVDVIDATELNPRVVEAARTVDPRSDPYAGAGTSLYIMDSRRFISTTQNTYDIILDAKTKRHGGLTYGGITTNYSATLEAIEAYLTHLGTDGIFAHVRATREESGTVPIVFLYALHGIGLDPADRAVLIGGTDVTGDLVLIRKKPFTPDEKRVLEREARKRGYPYIAFATAEDSKKSAGAVDEGVTDERPFVASIGGDLYGTGSKEAMRNTISYLFAMFSIAAGLLVVLTIGCALFGRFPWKRAVAGGVYFPALGFGLICFEVALIQKFSLLLADPSYAIAVTLFTVLLFGGLGSMMSKMLARRAVLTAALFTAGMVASIALIVMYEGALVEYMLPYGIGVRMLGVVAALALPSFLSGTFFPMGIIRIVGHHSSMVPWAWSIGGVAGVMGGVVEKILLLQYGITEAFIAVIGAYLVAGISLLGFLYMERGRML